MLACDERLEQREHLHNPRKAQQSQNHSMPDKKLWPLNLGIDERRNETSAVCNGELCAGGGCAHVMAGRVVADPTKNTWDRGVETGRHQECHSVFDLVGFDIGNHCVADDSERQRREHDRATEAEVIREEGNADWKR